MKQFYLNINCCKEIAAIEIRHKGQYVIDKVAYKKRMYFPLFKILKMVAGIEWKLLTKKLSKENLTNKFENYLGT